MVYLGFNISYKIPLIVGTALAVVRARQPAAAPPSSAFYTRDFTDGARAAFCTDARDFSQIPAVLVSVIVLCTTPCNYGNKHKQLHNAG